MVIAALIHTEGVVLFRKYFVLELSYIDILNEKRHFFIRSPIPYLRAKKIHKHLFKSLETIMCTSKKYNQYKVYPISEVRHFLKHKYLYFKQQHRNVLFAFKGRSYQKNILNACHIPSINIEKYKIPSVRSLMFMYPKVRRNCCFHKKINNKCSEHILRLICFHISARPTA